eukprot:Rmarinus@m.16497
MPRKELQFNLPVARDGAIFSILHLFAPNHTFITKRITSVGAEPINSERSLKSSPTQPKQAKSGTTTPPAGLSSEETEESLDSVPMRLTVASGDLDWRMAAFAIREEAGAYRDIHADDPISLDWEGRKNTVLKTLFLHQASKQLLRFVPKEDAKSQQSENFGGVRLAPVSDTMTVRA